MTSIDLNVVATIVQILAVVAGAVWAVGSIRSKTSDLGVTIISLSRSIDKLDRSIDKLEVAVRDLDHRVTRLEVRQGYNDHKEP